MKDQNQKTVAVNVPANAALFNEALFHLRKASLAVLDALTEEFGEETAEQAFANQWKSVFDAVTSKTKAALSDALDDAATNKAVNE